PRFLTYNEGSKQYVVMVEDVITHFINHLFTGYEVLNIDTDDAINSAIVQIPSLIPRFLTYNEGSKQYVVMVEDVITHFINHLFTGYE
ncbi:hypothetical protein, partial [Streptococcus pneumoniae]|uniref:hypothetical protein n=1 Tax=Streptococcus pneumoniae TaxID=1313 RepID=UPI00124A5F09